MSLAVADKLVVDGMLVLCIDRMLEIAIRRRVDDGVFMVCQQQLDELVERRDDAERKQISSFGYVQPYIFSFQALYAS